MNFFFLFYLFFFLSNHLEKISSFRFSCKNRFVNLNLVVSFFRTFWTMSDIYRRTKHATNVRIVFEKNKRFQRKINFSR